MLEPGKLRHLAAFEEKAVTFSPTGAPIETWSEYAPAWIAIESSGREFWAAAQINAELTHMVTARWIDGVTPQMRVNHAGRLFDIKAVIDHGDRRAEMRLLCTENANG